MNATESFAVLLVDDDAAFRSGVVNTLHRLMRSCTVHEAGGGIEAVDMLTRHAIDCVLLDNQMPGGSGLQWLSRIRLAREDLAVIMLTGDTNQSVAVEAMKSGAIDFLVKGALVPADLHRAILHALENLRMRRTIATQREALLKAEQLRVMFESLGAACHLIGQPMTTLSACIEMMRRQSCPPELEELLQQSMSDVGAISDILNRLRSVNEYRTVPYLSAGEGAPPRSDARILDV